MTALLTIVPILMVAGLWVVGLITFGNREAR